MPVFASGARLVPVSFEEITHFAPLVYFDVTPGFCHIPRASSTSIRGTPRRHAAQGMA